MKILKNYIAVALIATLITGCVDLDTYPESSYLTSDQKTETADLDPSKIEAGVNAVFTQFKTYNIALGADLHNDIGYPAIMLIMDHAGYDFVSLDDGYNWYRQALNYNDRTYTSDGTRIHWNTLYKQIYSANNVIATIDPDTEDPTSQYYLAQALGARGFSYWVLAQLFQFNYVGNESKLCVPLVTVENALEVGMNGAPRATVGETYDLIMSDLNKAVDLMESTTLTPADKRYISKATALGLRARVNLTMQKWADAAKDADAAITAFSGAPYSMADVGKPTFNTSEDAAWMWGIVIAETDRVVTTGICNFPSHMGAFNYGYATYSKGKQISKKLYNTISESDIRKGWWADANGVSANLSAAQQAYFDKDGFGPYTQVKYAPYKDELGTSTNASDIPLMRIEEMYLIKAEGLAMAGNTAEAKSVLESLIKTYRDPLYTTNASSAAALQEEIYRQRRIEFWGEGLSWFDIMRLGVAVDRRGAGYPDAATIYNIAPGSPILLYRIPEAEMQSNPLIPEEDNNPSAPKPDSVPDTD